jgi:hypothetical protein
VLDHIADGDDADKFALLDHRDVTEFAFGHLFHDGGDGFASGASRDFARHDPAHWLIEYAGAALSERAHNIALGKNAGDAAVHAKDDHRADALLGEKRNRGGKRGVGFNADDLAALGREYDADCHRSLPKCLHVHAIRFDGGQQH